MMPQLTVATILQLTLLLSALPAQYLISRWTGASVAQRYHATKRVLVGGEEEGEVPGESPALEVMLQDNDLGFFGASRLVRRPRPPFVFLRVGDVVMERNGHMIGVIVSWDPELRAPPEWMSRLHPNEEVNAENTPHYKVLFSGPGPSSLLVGYLPQTRLERVTGTRPEIPTLEQYFTHFDGERFIMQSWLQEIFPED
ncbi:uncharacterized protein si:dkey-261l7.2 isoform X3 [Oncorhynchus keta]|uniref:uncharacterized protein si:dkey-261l7.2 isoform X3 n=1 Tax=Oncorhynchus keta TaxID=8018 RepID=UPI0015F87B5E|nr:uncharacterized protein si:dkey-261l7.2 isoform X3 [Oncorhynchus keta]XP_052382459.1 uncharacterized protein si:dkey-261l7.2 isoform X3 [Oncorhynchus keta]